MGVYQRDGRFLVYWHENGKRRDKSFGRGEKAQALAEAFDQAVRQAGEASAPVPDPVGFVPEASSEGNAEGDGQDEEADPEPAPIPVKDRGGGITFGELSKMYLNHLRVSGRTEKHIVTLAGLLKSMFFPLISKDRPASSITYLDDIVPFIRCMQGESEQTKQPRAQATVNRYGDYLGAIFNFGVENELIPSNPIKKRKKSREKPRNVQLTVEDAKMIMEHAEPHIKWAMEVCFSLGTRPGVSELLSLRWENVDFVKSTVRIYATKTKTFRTVPLNPTFLERMKAMKEQAKSPCVIEFRGKPVTTIRKSFNNACELAGITYPVRMYDLRHLFATTMLSNGADLAAVSKLMGHSTIKMTADVYYHYLEGEKERAVSTLPSLVAV
ncbi:tyrosine-type recombinase/integrase [Fundidesulfovibrio agrisoli]|uniref:tyrosine-type recombinase/integrase n=1 Tax=Fundidesulfovibrio agrisoli TaxID=2922717 RepID=UPI001FAB46F9|nr:tyrosine-type recombinase/integrase [Fundidesulfovibrio agrisoli]